MSKREPMSRKRVTKATKARDAMLLRLIEELRRESLSAPEIQGVLDSSPSCVRTYINDLFWGQVIVLNGTTSLGSRGRDSQLYKLTEDEAKIQSFKEQLLQRDGDYVPKEHRAVRKPKNVPGSRIHTMSDDLHFQVRRAPVRPPKPDPLLAAFFGLTPQSE